MSTRWCASCRRFRRRRQPRTGFDYPPRDSHHAVSRPPTPFEVTRLPTPQGCRSAHGLSPSRVFPRARSVLLSKPLPSCRFHTSKPHPWMGAKTRSRLQGVRSRAESVRIGWAQDESRNRRQAPFPSWSSILSRASTRMRLAHALIAEPPFTPFGRVTSLSTGATRSRVRTGEQVLLGTCSSHEVSCLPVVHAPSAAPRYNRKDRVRTAPADAVRTSASIIGFPPTLHAPAS